MNNNEKQQSFLKGKGASVAWVIGFVAVIALVGTFTFRNYQNKLEQQVAQAEQETEEMTKEKTETTTTNDIVLPEAERDTSDAEENEKAVEEDASSDSTEETTGSGYNVWFDESSTLDWPASGAVLIDYSMDKTVYFPTLEQYKYNPALVISGEAGEMIAAAQEGVISSIEQDAQTGLTVTVDMGNGYSAVYGQLKEVPVEIGMYVNKGQTLGHLSEPTKYYSVEGPNLYFELLKDGTPVNPLDYMEG